MYNYAAKLEFENAQQSKEKLQILENYQTHTTIVSSNINDVDVFGIISDEAAAYVNYFKIKNGSIIQSYTTEIKKMLDETDEEILEEALIEIRNKFNSTSTEIFLPFHPKLSCFPRV